MDKLYEGTNSGNIRWQRYKREHFFCFYKGSLFELIGWIQPPGATVHLFEHDTGGTLVDSFNSQSKGAYLLDSLYALASDQAGLMPAPVGDLKRARLSGAGSRIKNVIAYDDRNYLPEIVSSTARIPLVEDIRSIIENLFDNRQTKGPEDVLTGILVSLLKSSEFFLKHTLFDLLGYSGICPDELTYSSGKSVVGTPLKSGIRPDIWISDKNANWDRDKDPIPGDTRFNLIFECKFGANFTKNQLQSLRPLKAALGAAGGHCLLIHIGKKPIDTKKDPFQGFGGNPFDHEITWNNLIKFSKADLQQYGDRDALISMAMIQALDRELGNVAIAGESVGHFVDFLIQQIKDQWQVKVRRQNNQSCCIRIGDKMLIEVKLDNSILVSEIPDNPQHQMALGAFFYSDLRAGSENLINIMNNLKQFYDAI